MWRAGLQAVFLYFSVEGSFADAEDFGGLFSVACRLCEGLGDGLLFELVEGDAGQTGGAACAEAADLVYFGGDVLNVDPVAVAHNHHSPDTVAELADIAGPIVIGKGRHSSVCYTGDFQAGLLGGLFQEVPGELWYILCPISQRGQGNIHPFDSEV